MLFSVTLMAGHQAADRGGLQSPGKQHAGGPTHLQPGETSLHHRQRHLAAHPQVTHECHQH